MILTAQAIIRKLKESKFPRTDGTEVLMAIQKAKLDSQTQDKLASDLINALKPYEKDAKLKEIVYQIAEILNTEGSIS